MRVVENDRNGRKVYRRKIKTELACAIAAGFVLGIAVAWIAVYAMAG